MTTVEKIHAEIDNAVIVLSEPPEINKELASVREKTQRLKALGFINSKQVVKVEEETKAYREKLEVYNLQQETYKCAQYYQKEYPFLKFLTEEMFTGILDKYGLVSAPVKNYIEDVPEKNLREIETAQPLKLEDDTRKQYKLILDYMNYVPQNVREWFNEKVFDEIPPEDDDELRELCPLKYEGKYLYLVDRYTRESVSREGLFIAAPPSHFNLEGLEKREKHGFFEVIRVQPKDPIVFRYCRGGIQVLSKWGEEAEDTNLVIPLTN